MQGASGSGAGDIDGVGSSRMFPNLNADPTLAASYNFGPSDTMINDIVAAGAEVYFRVGRSNLTEPVRTLRHPTSRSMPRSYST